MKLAPVAVSPELDAYLESLLPTREPVLARIEGEIATENVPGIGPQVGALLSLLLRAASCRDLIELGTATGYSAIWLARGCSGRVVTLELDPGRAARARGNLAEAGLGDRVEVVEEEAMSYLGRPGPRVGCVFNDLLNSFPDEAVVERCFQLSMARLEPGGLLLADNALRRGEVLEPSAQPARNVARWNRLVASEPRLRSVVVPLRDGVSIARLES